VSSKVIGAERQILRNALRTMQNRFTHQLREVVADAVKESVNAMIRLDEKLVPDAAMATAIERMGRHGYAVLGDLLGADHAAEIRAYFESIPFYSSRDFSQPFGVIDFPDDEAHAFPIGYYRLEDVVGAPHLLETALGVLCRGVATHYIGCTPTLYGLDVWWSFAGGNGRFRHVTDFHRSLDDYRACHLYILLTDVEERAGTHEIIRSTHRMEACEAMLETAQVSDDETWNYTLVGKGRLDLRQMFIGNGAGKNEAYKELFAGAFDSIYGPAGTSYAVEPYALQRPITAKRGRILVFRASFGLYDNAGAGVVRPRPVPRGLIENRLPDDTRFQYIHRLLFR
jgi:hypothetical protein